jgi:hypothetical protein
VRLGRHIEAEQHARQALEIVSGDASWRAMLVIVRSLHAKGRDAEARAFMEEYGIDDYDLEDDL